MSLKSDLDQRKEERRFGRSMTNHCLYILQTHLNKDPQERNKKKKKAFYSSDTQPQEQTAITQTFNKRKQGNKINEINITYVLLN